MNRKDLLITLAKIAARSRGRWAVARLYACLGHDDSSVRETAAQVLGQLGDPRAVEPLCTLLGDRDCLVRAEAARSLGQLGDPRAFEPLCACLGDKDWGVRQAAAQVLGRLGDPRAFEPLWVCLGDENNLVRVAAAAARGQLGDSRGVEALGALLFAPGSVDMQRTVVAALGASQAREALPALRRRLRCPSGGSADARVKLPSEEERDRNPIAMFLVSLWEMLAQGLAHPPVDVHENIYDVIEKERIKAFYKKRYEREIRREIQAAITSIEAATAHVSDLPIASGAPAPRAEGLPIPGVAPQKTE